MATCFLCAIMIRRIKTNSFQPKFNAIYEQQRQTPTSSRERHFALRRESTIDFIMNILVLEYESILQVIEGVTTIIANNKDIEFKMRLGWLTKVILI